MAFVCEKDMCCGCMACISVCKKNAIKIIDSLDAYNAVIDEERCIHCNACERVCQYNHKPNDSMPISWYQGWVESAEVRRKSSSGGIAAAIAHNFILNGGYVCSCAFKDGQFGFHIATTTDQCAGFAGSKYVKSNPIGVYEKIKEVLLLKKKVLFIGLPCQVAAVKNYLGTNNDNLYLIDLVCHGTPSPKLLESFLSNLGYSLEGIDNIRFRNKTNFRINCNFEDILPERVADMYTHAFLQGVDYTENCYHCKYAQLGRISDITLGDSWGSVLPIEEQRKGISLILCQTTKGEELIKNAKLHLKDVDLEKAMEANEQLKHPTERPKSREQFFKVMKSTYNFNKAIAKCYPKIYYKQVLKMILIKLKIIGGDIKKKD